MSGIYWGIVAGLLVMVVTLLVSMAIYYGSPGQSEDQAGSDVHKGKRATKHAA